MTRICIILAVFLVTSIFSMAEMWTDAETTAMRHNHGDWHIALQNVSKDEAEQIRKNSNVAVSSWYDEINTDAEQNYYIDGKNAVLYGIEESYITDIMKYPTEGVYPQNETNTKFNQKVQTKYLANAAYLKIQNITLSYSLPKNICQKIYMDNIRVFVSGENLHTWDHLPEGMESDMLSKGAWEYPFMKKYSLGINVTF